MNRSASFLLLFALLMLGSCSDLPEIDSYITFNITRSVDFSLSNVAQAGIDTAITVAGKIDTLKDYSAQGSGAYLLHTSKVTRVYLHASDPNFTLDHLVYARVLIGTDTIAFDSIPQFTPATFIMDGTGIDITNYMRDTSFDATLQFKLSKSLPDSVTITAGITIVHTALEPVSK